MARARYGAQRRDRAVNLLAAALLLGGGATAVLAGPNAQAEADRTNRGPAYPAGASVTHFKGLAFDTCLTPNLATMRAWLASPYRAVGVYVSGSERACKRQPNLTREWVSAVSRAGWKLMPIDVGKQAPCRMNLKKQPIKAQAAHAEGVAAAGKAVAAAANLGILPGSALYSDLEPYRNPSSTCIRAVANYLSGWTTELHRRGYLAGMYAHHASGSPDAAARYSSTKYARADALWTSQWDRKPRLTGWAGIKEHQWANHQRIKQYRGDHLEKHGGVAINIDSNIVDAPVATVAIQLPVRAGTTARREPRADAAQVGTPVTGGTAAVLCRVPRRDGNWYKLTDGSYLPSAALSGTEGRPLPSCVYAVPVLREQGAIARTGAGTKHPARSTLPLGALGWVQCRHPDRQAWLRLWDGSWVWGANLGAGGPAGASLPRCEEAARPDGADGTTPEDKDENTPGDGTEGDGAEGDGAEGAGPDGGKVQHSRAVETGSAVPAASTPVPTPRATPAVRPTPSRTPTASTTPGFAPTN